MLTVALPYYLDHIRGRRTRMLTVPEQIDRIRTAARLVRRRWARGSWQTLDGGHCAVGALYPHAGFDIVYDYEGLAALVAETLNLTSQGAYPAPYSREIFKVTVWNDEPGQTAENVAQGLEFVALCLEQEQQLEQQHAEREVVTT